MELHELTAHELAELIKNRKVSVPEVTQSTLDRIHNVEEKIGSYLTVCDEQALERAKLIQKKIERNETSSCLAGVPMALKDNMCTKELKTTCGSKALYNFEPPYNATVVNKLEEADTVLMGKLNMDEFAMGSSNETSYYQKTKNPWDLERVPGGSSGGAASSVAAGEAYFSFGSDTGGSIRQPAAFCGVVGMKPTYGAVSRFGLIAFASSLDQIGPFTKDVEDMAHVLNIITGHDSLDSTSANIKYPDYTKFLKSDIKGLKIGIPKEYFGEGNSPEVVKCVYEALDTLKSLGATYEEFSLPLTEYAIPAYYIIASAEASSNLARFDGVQYGFRSEKFSDLVDLYKNSRSESFGTEVKRRIMLGTYALSSGYYDAYYKKALKVRTLITNGFEEAFKKFDVIVGPTCPITAFKFGEKLQDPISMYLQDIYTVSANIAGIPGISIPCGHDSNNLPIGLQFIGKAFDEGTLIRAGYTFQMNTDFHKRRAKI